MRKKSSPPLTKGRRDLRCFLVPREKKRWSLSSSSAVFPTALLLCSTLCFRIDYYRFALSWWCSVCARWDFSSAVMIAGGDGFFFLSRSSWHCGRGIFPSSLLLLPSQAVRLAKKKAVNHFLVFSQKLYSSKIARRRSIAQLFLEGNN